MAPVYRLCGPALSALQRDRRRHDAGELGLSDDVRSGFPLVFRGQRPEFFDDQPNGVGDDVANPLKG
jgi:hypothetical protein